jgi:hypothetical protein
VLITGARPIGAPGPRIVYVNGLPSGGTSYTRAGSFGKSPSRRLRCSRAEGWTASRRALKAWQPVRAEVVITQKSGKVLDRDGHLLQYQRLVHRWVAVGVT